MESFTQALLTWRWSSLNEMSWHFAIECLSLIVIIYLLYRKPYDPRDSEKLSSSEQEDLISTWKPAPLANPLPVNARERIIPVIEKYQNHTVTINQKQYLNCASLNTLGLAGNETIRLQVQETIDKYGVGSCGPRGFYGTFDVHLKLEEDIARFYGAEAAILYSDAVAMMSSVIPAFAKRGDLIVCDESISFGVQQGIRLSRSNVLYYKHGDVADLERVLRQVQAQDAQTARKKLVRRFIVTEGISSRFGDIAPLARIVELKNQYKYRLIVDDSLAFGVLGSTGRGSLEHAGIPVSQCTLYCTALDTSLASVGGVCMGTGEVVAHQRLIGSGYCFSASSPPYTAVAAIAGLEQIQDHPEWVAQVKSSARYLRQKILSANIVQLNLFGGVCDSPVLYLHLSERFSQDRTKNEKLLLNITNEMMSKYQIIVYVPEYIDPDRDRNAQPSLCIQISRLHDTREMDRIVDALKQTASSCCKQLS